MKLIQHITDEDECLESYRLLGITIMERATVKYRRAANSNLPLSKVYKRYFGKIIYKSKYYNINGLFKNDLSIFSIPIIGSLKLNGYKLYFFLGIKVYSKPLKFLSDFKSECVDSLDQNYDDIYMLLHHLGDTYRMLTIIKGIIRNNQSKNPLLMVFSESFVDLIQMMNLEIPYVYIQTTKPFKQRMETQFSTDVFMLGGFRFFLVWNQWCWKSRFDPTSRKLPPDTNDLYIKAAAYNVIYDSHSMGKIEIIPEAEKSMLEKSKQSGLNLENFVFVAPEAFAYQMYYENFWEDVVKILQKSGYDVFINTVAGKGDVASSSYTNDKSRIIDLDSIDNVKSFYLTVAEAYALACRAKKIISQRSGFSELLVQTNAPMCVIYSGTDRNVVEKFKIRNSLLSAPYANANKIHELNVVGMAVSDSIKAVSDILHINQRVNI